MATETPTRDKSPLSTIIAALAVALASILLWSTAFASEFRTLDMLPEDTGSMQCAPYSRIAADMKAEGYVAAVEYESRDHGTVLLWLGQPDRFALTVSHQGAHSCVVATGEYEFRLMME